MNRREFLSGSAAMVGGSYLTPAVTIAQVQPSTQEVVTLPEHLLATTFSEQVLRAKLVPVGKWHPYPKASERDQWMQVPDDLRAAMTHRAEAWMKKPWPSLDAITALDFKRNGNRSYYEAENFGRRHRLIDLVLGECAEGKGRFLDEIANGVWLICEESFWGVPAHLGAQKAGVGLPDVSEPIVDLFAAETSSTMAWIHYLIEKEMNSVSPLIAKRIRMEAKRRVLDPCLSRDDFWWMGLGSKRGHLNNWNPWINSNWLMTAMLLEDDPERRIHALTKSCRSLDEFLHDYSPDGGCEEGPVYWQRSPGSYFDCCRTLASAVNDAADVMTHPFVQRMGQYIADVHIAGKAYVNYGDAHMEDAPTPELVYRYGIAAKLPGLAAFGAYSSAKDSLGVTGDAKELNAALGAGLASLARNLPDVLCAREVRAAKKEDALVRDAWYPDLHLMTSRVKAGTSDGFYLAVQAASNGRSHGHNDSGSFIVFHDGEPALIDPGVEAYTAKTFSTERYTIWTMQSAYHNLPTIGGVMQHEGNAYAASEVKYSTSDDAARITMNLATAYPPGAGAKRWMRECVLDRGANVVKVREEFTLSKPVEVALSLMTPRLPSPGDGVVVLHSTKNAVKDVTVRFDAKVLRPSVEKIVLEDEDMQRSWGPALYRVRLTTISPVADGRWEIVVG